MYAISRGGIFENCIFQLIVRLSYGRVQNVNAIVSLYFQCEFYISICTIKIIYEYFKCSSVSFVYDEGIVYVPIICFYFRGISITRCEKK